MNNLKKILKFFCFWCLVLFYGVLSCFYVIGTYILSNVFTRNKNQKQTYDDDVIQPPPILAGPIYGKHRFVKLQGVKLHYIEEGKPENPLLILVHGVPGFWFCWRKQISILANHFWVVSLDLRGCGDSEVPKRRSEYKTGVITKDIAQLIKSLNHTSAYLIFNETSCNIGWHFATAFPNLVKKIVYINSPHPFVIRNLFQRSFYHYLKYWQLLFLQVPLLPEMFVMDKSNRILDLVGLNSSKHLTNEEVDAYKYNFSRREDWYGVVQHLRQIEIFPFFENPHPPILTCPSLLLMGSNHPYLSREAAYRSAEFVERIKIKMIEGGKTSLQVTHSQLVTDEILNFFGPLTPAISANPSMAPTYRNSLVERVIGVVKNPYSMLTARMEGDDLYSTA